MTGLVRAFHWEFSSESEQLTATVAAFNAVMAMKVRRAPR